MKRVQVALPWKLPLCFCTSQTAVHSMSTHTNSNSIAVRRCAASASSAAPDVTPVAVGRSVTVTDAIETRRSVREFTKQQLVVPKAIIQTIVERSARAASGGNIQPWKACVAHACACGRSVDVVAKANSNAAKLDFVIVVLSLRVGFKVDFDCSIVGSCRG